MFRPVPIDTCENPILVSSGDGSIFVPCGKCSACRRSKHSKWRSRLASAIDTHAASLFVTLTYSNDHLPLCELDPVTGEVLAVTYTRFRPGKKGDDSILYDRVDLFEDFYLKDATFDSTFLDLDISEFPHFVSHRHADGTCEFDTSSCFAVCLRKDVQDFVKRLRSILSRDASLAGRDTSFDYFICSEYGPGTFRPHYHGILLFHDTHIASLCNTRYVHEAWRKSSLSPNVLEKESQLISFGKGASSYTSKYVTCDTDLPSFLGNKFFKPFTSSSHSEPIGSSALPFSAISHTVRETDLLHDCVFKDKDTGEFVTVRIPYPSSLWARYFPRFLFQRRLPTHVFSRLLYRIFSLDPYKPLPDLVREFNDKYDIGRIRLTKSSVSYLKHISFDSPDAIWRSIGVLRPSDFTIRNFVTSSYRITYSDIFYKLVSDPNFIDYFLFGIPQNRTVVNKILRLRVLSLSHATLSSSGDLPISDHWCDTFLDYLDLYNLFYTKHFNNSLRTFYDNFTANYSGSSFTPELISEYYPTFYRLFPAQINAFDDSSFQMIETILSSRFGLTVESFYDSDGNLISYDHRSKPHYYNFRSFITDYHREFDVKRKYNHFKYNSL